MMQYSGILVAIFLACVVAQNPPTLWKWVNPTVTAKSIGAVGYGNGKYVLVVGGDASSYSRGYTICPEVITTSDWKTFSHQEFNLSVNIYNAAITYGESGFVVVFGTKVYLTSADGVSWSIQTLSQEVNSVVYANGYYAMYYTPSDYGTTALVSQDAIHWTLKSIPLPTNTYDWNIFTTSNSFYCGGDATSSIVQTASFNHFTVNNITGGTGLVFFVYENQNNELIAVLGNSYDVNDVWATVFFAYNGKTWSKVGTLDFYNSAETAAFAYGSGVCLIWTGTWAMTTDETTFQNISYPFDTNELIYETSITYANLFIAFTDNGELATADTDFEWTIMDEGIDGSIYTVFYHDNQFVLSVAVDSYIPSTYTSTDGLTWNLANGNIGLADLHYDHSLQAYAGSSGSTIYYSSTLDGTWTGIDAGLWISSWAFGNDVWVVQYNNAQWAHSYGCLNMRGFNGNSWTTTWSYTGPGCPPCQKEWILTNVVYGGAQKFYVANTLNATILSSVDGKTWDVDPLPAVCWYPGELYAINGYIYLYCNDADAIIRSEGDNVWQTVTGLPSTVGYFNYLNGLYYAVGYEGQTFSSTDGLAWNPSTSIVSDSCSEIFFFSAAYGNGVWLALGEYYGYVGEGETMDSNIIYRATK